MDYQLLKCLLNHAFWIENRKYLNASLFEDEIKELYEVLELAHGVYSKDLTTEELLALWRNLNPVATRAETANISEVIKGVAACESYSPEISRDLIQSLWRRETGRKVAEYGIAVSEGKEEAFIKLSNLISNSKDGFMPDELGRDTTTDIDELISVVSDDNRWKFNINSLSREVYGMAPGEFGFVLARTNAGKTAFGVSLACSPNGWLDQGARVSILTNEEDSRRTMLRCVQAYSGWTKEQIIENPKGAKDLFSKIKNNLSMRDIATWSIGDIDTYLDNHKPDIVIIDMLDKVSVPGGKDIPSHERLGQIYLKARELCSYNKHNCVLLGMSQASDSATGRTVITPDMAEGSRTSKGAEADLILGIGMYPMDGNGNIEPIRFITIGKNKINGNHKTITCLLNAKISRYTD